MLSVGTDLIEIDRIKKSMKNPRFLKKILGATEYSQLQKRNFPAQSVAANFAAKEAFSKAVKTGISAFSLSDVELLRHDNGSPYLKLSGNALNIKNKLKYEFSTSVTHTKNYASAVVIAFRVNFQLEHV